MNQTIGQGGGMAAMAPRGIGEILRTALQLYRRHWRTLLAIAAVVVVPLTLLQYGIGHWFRTNGQQLQEPAEVSTSFWAVASASLLAALAGLLLYQVLTGAITRNIATDVAVLNHPRIGPRLRAQNQQLQSLLAGPDTSPSARLRAEAALGAIWRPLIAEPPLDLTNPTHQRTLIDAAVAALHPSRPSPNGEPIPATHTGPHGLVDAAIGKPALPTEVCDAKQELEAISE